MSGELGSEIRSLLEEHTALIPDFPEPGVLFRDIFPLIAHGPAFKQLVKILASHYDGSIDAIAGLESRGFILGAPVAVELGIGMIPVRKAGKLPGEVIGMDYVLEYGTARIEVQPSLIHPGERILILDDVLATGGTARAAIDLIEQCGATVSAVAVLLELAELQGRERLSGVTVESAMLA